MGGTLIFTSLIHYDKSFTHLQASWSNYFVFGSFGETEDFDPPDT